MNLFNILGLLSTVSLALPIFILIRYRLVKYRSFPALFFYYLFLISYNIILLGYVDVTNNFSEFHQLANNLLIVPLSLTFMLYFSKTVYMRRRQLIGLFTFIGFEAVTLFIYGFNTNTAMIILAPGLLLCLIISFLFFIHQIKIAVVYHRAVGKAIMITALLFTHVGFSFVYGVFLVKPELKNDAHLVYFLVTLFTSIPMAVGIYTERTRVQHLAELQLTRKELKSIYNEDPRNEKMTNPKEAVIFNFDKKQWS